MRILIVEDETIVAHRLARLLSELLGKRIRNITIQKSHQEAASALRDETPDVLFLDLNLNGRDGFELLTHAVSCSFHVIVVSANVDRALEAFEYGVLDFVPKPFSAKRLRKALERIDKTGGKAEHRARHLSVRIGDAVELIPLESVASIQGADNYSEIICINGRRLLHQKTLSRLETLLPDDFIRVHRSHIVNLHHAGALHSSEGSRYELTLSDGRSVPVGRTRVKTLRDALI